MDVCAFHIFAGEWSVYIYSYKHEDRVDTLGRPASNSFRIVLRRPVMPYLMSMADHTIPRANVFVHP